MKKRIALSLLILALISATCLAGWYLFVVKPYWQQMQAYDDTMEIDIPAGTPSRRIIAMLHEQGIISHPTYFQMMAWQAGHLRHYKAGEYAFEPRLTPQQISEMLVAGDVIERKVTIPEGWTVAQAVEALRQISHLKEDIPSLPPEGSLLPETYHYVKGESRQSVMKKMQAALQQVLQQAWQKRAEGLPFATMQEALILASIVEKETGIASERDKVAGVFINRLQLGMKLQSDPTANYGIYAETGNFKTRMLRKDIAHNSDYNTYLIDGLPPTPICNAGKASIEAVLNPAPTDALYFVADGKGGHVFARTLAEHNRNVAAYYQSLRE